MSSKTIQMSRWSPALAAAGLSYGLQNFPQYGPWPPSNGNVGNFARRYVGGQKSRSFRSKKFGRNSFKSRVMQIAPAYHKTIPDNTLAATILHNAVYTYNVTAQVVQGTTNQDRQGDAIQLLALKLKGVMSTASPIGAYQYRIIVGWSGEEFNPATLATTGLGSSDIFLPGTTTTYVTNGIINPKAFTAIYDEVMDFNSVTANAELGNINIKVPVRGKFSYQSTGSVYGKTKNLYIIVVGLIVGGTSGVTTTGGCAIAADLIFKNL